MAEDILILKAGAERIQHLESLWKVLHLLRSSRGNILSPGRRGRVLS